MLLFLELLILIRLLYSILLVLSIFGNFGLNFKNQTEKRNRVSYPRQTQSCA